MVTVVRQSIYDYSGSSDNLLSALLEVQFLVNGTQKLQVLTDPLNPIVVFLPKLMPDNETFLSQKKCMMWSNDTAKWLETGVNQGQAINCRSHFVCQVNGNGLVAVIN
jgi:hypothetical protein